VLCSRLSAVMHPASASQVGRIKPEVRSRSDRDDVIYLDVRGVGHAVVQAVVAERVALMYQARS
jgi:hypothetical protein